MVIIQVQDSPTLTNKERRWNFRVLNNNYTYVNGNIISSLTTNHKVVYKG